MLVEVTVTGLEVEEQPLELTVTEYEPGLLTLILCEVAPFDQLLPLTLLDVSVTKLPEQIMLLLLAVTVGVAGGGLCVTLNVINPV